jgi:FXSXX-COOH protein
VSNRQAEPAVPAPAELAEERRDCLWEGGLPDLTAVDLESLRALDHPVLARVLDEVVRRSLDPSGVLSAHDNSMP